MARDRALLCAGRRWRGVALLGLASKGVAIIGAVPAGLPRFALPRVSLGDVGTLVPFASGLAFVAFAQSILTARAFADGVIFARGALTFVWGWWRTVLTERPGTTRCSPESDEAPLASVVHR